MHLPAGERIDFCLEFTDSVGSVLVDFRNAPLCSDPLWRLLRPSSGAPGGGGWLCHHVAQHGWSPCEALSFLQEFHFPNSLERSWWGPNLQGHMFYLSHIPQHCFVSLTLFCFAVFPLQDWLITQTCAWFCCLFIALISLEDAAFSNRSWTPWVRAKLSSLEEL